MSMMAVFHFVGAFSMAACAVMVVRAFWRVDAVLTFISAIALTAYALRILAKALEVL